MKHLEETGDSRPGRSICSNKDVGMSTWCPRSGWETGDEASLKGPVTILLAGGDCVRAGEDVPNKVLGVTPILSASYKHRSGLKLGTSFNISSHRSHV